MNDNHHRHLLATFQYVDNLLAEAEQVLASTASASPFQQYAPDSTPTQRKVIHDYIVRVREAMRRILTELKIPLPRPICGALWAAQNQLSFASIAIAELEPQRVRGYGALSEEDIRTLNGIVAELNALIDRIRAYLAQGADADLQARLRKLEATRDEIRLLRELERIITAHGLVEFRGTLALLLDRLENGGFEIGIFGRVSSGKSSLLNHLLESEFLPVGVTPVTAIPTRISYGSRAEATIQFAEGKPLIIELSRLGEFSSEQQNPSNAKHVTHIQVELPAKSLREGVTFVDTPGLGSLAVAGAEETVAYLPRCDLGVVLVDAASTLTHEDLVVVQSLYQSGATATVLVSKADLLQPADRPRALRYIQEQLARQLNLELPVHLVSVVGAEAALCDEWLETKLMPLCEAHRDLMSASLKRKIGSLREAVIRALEARLQCPVDRLSPESGHRLKEAEQALRGADAILEQAQREGEEFTCRLSEAFDRVIEIVAADIAAAWSRAEPPTSGAEELFATSSNRTLSAWAAQLTEMLANVRSKLSQTLELARRALPAWREASGELPKATGLPMVNAEALSKQLILKKPWLLSRLGEGVLRRYTRRQLEEQLGAVLPEVLSLYSKRLRVWFQQALTELREAFVGEAGLYKTQLERWQTPSSAETSEAQVETDLRLLREWPTRFT